MSHLRKLTPVLSLLLAACTTTAPAPSWDYQSLVARPTPASWASGAVWSFTITDRSGKPETLMFRVSSDLAKTCISGEWRKLELIGGKAGTFAGVESQPAYSVEGSFLWISLNSNLCDADNDLRGELNGNTFTGEHTFGGVTGDRPVGVVQGQMVRWSGT